MQNISITNKNSNVLVGMYLNEITREELLSACLYNIVEQSHPVDLLIVTNGLSDEQKSVLKKVVDAPYFPLIKKGEDKQIIEEKKYSEKKLNYTIVENEAPIFFSAIFNTIFNAAMDNGYEAMSVIEQEDTYTPRWFEFAEKYKSELPAMSIFVPLIRATNNGVFTGLLNEAPLVEGYVHEVAKFDFPLFERMNACNVLGGYFLVKPISENSEQKEDGKYYPMKESIKYSHYYEFFSRMAYADLKIMVISRIGYDLNVVNKLKYSDATCKLPTNITSLPEEQGGITPEEGQFYFDLAKKELFVDKDRNKVYQKA